MDRRKISSISFYPVVHLLTGPPGLARNGGIWKRIKTDIVNLGEPVNLMSQVLHFAMYEISDSAWWEWNYKLDGRTTIEREVSRTFGPRRDLFLDSGGFQLLYGDKIDLSRWSLKMTQEDILDMQLRFNPQRIASLDAPLPPSVSGNAMHDLINFTINNEKTLVDLIQSEDSGSKPYLAVHGREPIEVRDFLKRLFSVLPQQWVKRKEFGLALGSQVPLSGDKDRIISNAMEAISWMNENNLTEVPLHIFGIGDDVAGHILRTSPVPMNFSYDSSTYVKNAFRMKIFNHVSMRYELFDPYKDSRCNCWGCQSLRKLGPEIVHTILSGPSYHDFRLGERRIIKSEILAYIALHNIATCKFRLQIDYKSRKQQKKVPFMELFTLTERDADYFFPLSQFRPRSPNLIIIQCTKKRPYHESILHKMVLTALENRGLAEGSNFDRITLSGLYGPVHWKDEDKPAILSYDFPLNTPTISETHINQLRLKTAYVLKVIAKKYRGSAAVLTSKAYRKAFSRVLGQFGVPVFDDVDALKNADFYPVIQNNS